MNLTEFQEKIQNHPRPLLVDFWAPWCGPCRAMEPVFQRVSQKYAGRMDVLKINADESPEVVRASGVMGIPTVIGFSGGREILRRSGVQSDEALDILFDATLSQRKPLIIPPAPIDRLIRSAAGLALIALGWVNGQAALLFVAGAALVFSAFYDRCPIYRAVFPRLAAWFKRQVRA